MLFRSETMGFPHYVLDYENTFREAVIEEFADAYLAGATPVPCIRCNERVKFKDLLATAKDLEADCMATGHYIQRKLGEQGPELHQAADPARDQSYFLFSTTPEQLSYLRFPLGHLASKAETRALAAKYGLPVADKPDSQDICFVPAGKYSDIVQKLRPGAVEGGDIVHMDGRVMGRHEGVIRYTIGQRRGLGVATGEPLFVVKLDAPNRRVIVGPREALLTNALAFLCPSVYEPLGIVNLEAMACGTAVVASDVGGIPEVVDDGTTGLLVHYDVADAVRFETGLADAVNALVRDPERAHTFGQAGRRRCIDEFSWMQVAQQTLDIYRSVCG